MHNPTWLVLASFVSLTAACAGRTTPASTTPAPASAAAASAAMPRAPIAQADVVAAQRAWCDALVGLSTTHARGGDVRAQAMTVLDTAYDYAARPVLFKPTLTHGAQTFRMERAGALAYFVGGDPAYPDDAGFALKGWTSCTPTIKNWFTQGDVAMAMGNVTLTGKSGTVTVDKTFGYRRDEAGRLKIVLHHSSLPYQPPAAAKVSQSR